jgi:hypothetical protein
MKYHNVASKPATLITITIALLCLSLLSCLKSSDSGPAPATALVTVIQASPDQPPLTFYLNSDAVNLQPLQFGQGIDYFSAYSGPRVANFYASGTSTLVATSPITLATNGAYSLFLDNVSTKPGILLLADTLVKPATGDASVRFVDMSPDAPAVNLVLQGGKTLVSNQTFQSHSSFIPVSISANSTFNVVSAGNGTVLTSITGVQLTPGYVYTVVFEGLYNSTSSSDNMRAVMLTNAYFN